MLFSLSEKPDAKSKAIEIVQEFFDNEHGLVEAWVIKNEARRTFNCSADFNLIVKFTPEKEQHISRLAYRLSNETAPLTVRVLTAQEAAIFLPETIFQLFNNLDTRHQVAASIEHSKMFTPIPTTTSSAQPGTSF